jgi:hypothetical protein
MQAADQENPAPRRGLSLGVGLVVVAISFAAAAQGAFYGNQFRLVLGILGTALVVTLLPAGHRRVFWHPLLSAGAALAASAGLSAWVAGDAADALPAVGLLVGMGAAVIVVRESDPSEREMLVTAVVVVGALIAFSGWVGVVFRREPLAQVHQGLWRAASTITYANATAGFLLLPGLLALGRTAHRQRRELWSLASYLLLVGIVATLSRAGVLALGAGVATLALVSDSPRRTVAAVWPAALGVGIAVLGLLPSAPDQVSARPGVAVFTFAAGATVAVLIPQASGRALLLILILSVGAITVGIAYLTPVGANISSGGRLSRVSDDRVGAWRAALRLSLQRPALGLGTGNAMVEYRSKDGDLVTSRYVHNEYLQLLAEQGGVGVALLLGGIAFNGRRIARTRKTVPDSTWTGGVASLTALGIHSAVDFLWHVPVIPLTTAVILGLLAEDGRARGTIFRCRRAAELTRGPSWRVSATTTEE